MRLNIWKPLAFSLLILFTFAGCGASEDSEETTTAPPPATTTQKTLFAVYMMGSDLETNNLAGSYDLEETVKGYYNHLTADQQKNIEIKVAFGGSNSSTWNGVKYADIDCLYDDQRDGVFGNDSCYTYTDASANMSAQQSLTDFINSLSLSTTTYDKTIFTFWNHGGAYDGVCYDENGGDQLTLDELDASLRATNSSFDIIGMDACLMGSLEVAKTLSSFGTYLIASEELEPGHGWNYEELIKWLGENPNATLTNISKSFVDSYIDTAAHASTRDKTLSVIDLKKVDDFVGDFTTILSSLSATSDFSSILNSAKDSQQYAINSKYSVPTGRSMDVKHFLENLKPLRPDLSTQIDALNTQVDNFVVYNRYQDSKINSNGISVFQPLNTGQWDSVYKTKTDFISTDWFNLVGDFLTIGLGDAVDPVKTSESGCVRSTVNGYCMDVTDDIGISEAEGFNLIPYNDQGDYILLGTDKLAKTGTSEYFLAEQDDNWLYFCNGPSDTASCIFPSAIFIGEFDSSSVYASYANVNGKYSEFYIAVDENGNLDYWAVEVNDSGVASKSQTSIAQGDRLQFYYYIVSTGGNDYWTVGGELTFSQAPVTTIFEMDVDVSYFASFSDFKGNSITSGIYTTLAD